MARTHREHIDTRIALRVYAIVVGLGGLLLAGWGPLWFGPHLPELPWGRAAVIRLSGSVMMASAVLSFGLATADVLTRRRLLSWFIAGHVVVWAMLQLQYLAVLGGSDVVRHASWALLTLIVGLLYVRFPSNPTPRPHLSVWHMPDPQGTDGASHGLYEQQIRDAAAQEERNRLARDLHDAVKQQIFAIQTSAAAAEARFDTDTAGARDALAQVRQSAREAMAEMQAMLDQLRVAPLGHTGLVEAIRKQCDALAFRTGASVEVQVGALPDTDTLEPGTHEAIYRIVQEALANVGRHARARHVQVSLHATPLRLEVAVKDDGLGFDREAYPDGMGLHNMRARAREIGGSIEVTAAGGAGTLVTLSVPIETADEQAHRRRQALIVVGLLGATIGLFVVDLLEDGPGLGNVSLIVFALLAVQHFRTWLRLRRRGSTPAATTTERAS